MRLSVKNNLPFVSILIAYQGKATDIPDVLIDTGSATSILAADILEPQAYFRKTETCLVSSGASAAQNLSLPVVWII